MDACWTLGLLPVHIKYQDRTRSKNPELISLNESFRLETKDFLIIVTKIMMMVVMPIVLVIGIS